ncbi:MAG: hypothetical protein WBQ14_11565 [Gaiellaceae bacterium]
MAAALSSKSIAEIVLLLALVPFLVGYLIRRRRRIPIAWLTVRNGQVALTDKGRVKIGNRGMEVSAVEESLRETFYVDEDGDISFGGRGE